MNINRNNYEAYFLDYIEGRLSPDQEEVLRRFLKFNPDLEEELNSFDLQNIDAPLLSFPGKESLKKEQPGAARGVHDANFDMYCVAYLEGDLEKSERVEFEAFLEQHPGRKSELETFRTTFLKPGQIRFPFKRKLKHYRLGLTGWRIMVPVAAAAAIALMVFLQGPGNQYSIEIASVVEPELLEKKPVEKKEDQQPEVKPVQATFNLVRKTNSPVPVTDYNEKQQERLERQKDQETKEQQGESRRIARVDLSKQQTEYVPVQYDRLHPEIIQPPTINNSSLSVLALARYQAQKATQMMEEEDALLWSLASSGIRELNRITGSETSLMASRDEEGAISGIRFKSRFLDVTAPIARND